MNRLLAIILFAIIGSVNIYAQRFSTKVVRLSNNGVINKNISIRPSNTFTIKRDNRYTWAQYETTDNSIRISVSENSTNKSRSCCFILFDDKGYPVDTLELIQDGKTTSAVSSVSKTTNTSNKKVSGGQCAARTKKGSRCSRQASPGSIYCWQHKKK